MVGSSRFNLLVVILVAFTSFVTARTVITSQTCATSYCDVAPKKVYKVTRTIHKRTPYTVTRWKTIIPPKSTRTIKVVKTVTSQKYSTVWQTLSTTTLITKWIGTTTHTRTVHDTTTITTKTVTVPTSTFTVTTPSVTVPAPSGFVGVADDTDNSWDVSPPDDGPWWAGKRRSAEPEPEPAPKKKYVAAVTCIKTILTKTGTSDLCKTTKKAAATTTKTVVVSTKTVLKPLLTVTKTTTKIASVTTSKYKVAFASGIFFTSTRTAYTDTTTYLTTVSSDLPAPTYYESCGPRNKTPGPRVRQEWVLMDAGPDEGETVHVIWGNGTSHDCCAACHTYNQGGVCVGSLWRALTWWGEQKCLEPPIGPEPCPEVMTKCELIIAASDAPDQCRQRKYTLGQERDIKEGIVSNGLNCKRFKFAGWL
ncbi:hypothetical protein TWF730_011176 [Orbilia blumenaviensis]|uniref:Uncharacterized protein n=1 Tax=Orbilia blumenaviensis TaxID=1796055 RepID=A0AAV9UN30_9PEZI